MQVFKRNDINLDANSSAQITEIITTSLKKITTQENQFIVNDTLWFAEKRKGGVSPCVINSASYLSKNFQKNLASVNNWNGETRIDGQNFDGFGELKLNGFAYNLREEKIIPFLKDYIKINKSPEHSLGNLFSIFYGMYIRRSIFSLNEIPTELHNYFVKVPATNIIRIGVEFETGNIASSFRALMKLNYLFIKNHIDIGVFITSNNKKECSAKIWPSSNRNGSFEELQQRNYKDNVNLPLLEFGFAPDHFSKDVGYLGENGSLFMPKDSDTVVRIKNVNYRVFTGCNNDKILLPE